jgi:hypothetical protein
VTGSRLIVLVALFCVSCGRQIALGPATMPPADGRPQTVQLGPQSFIVNRQIKTTMNLRITRLNGPDLDYSDGALAKRVATSYCATYRRRLDPAAMARFSAPNAWVFGGDCL